MSSDGCLSSTESAPAGKLYQPVGQCIYCGSLTYDARKPQRTLSVEHIIPEGLGGNLKLPESCCSKCEGAASAFEGTCQRVIFGALRIYLQLPTKRPRERPKALPIKISYSYLPAIKEYSVQVPISQYPIMLSLIKMDPPLLISKPQDGYRTIIVNFYPIGNGGSAGIDAITKVSDERIQKVVTQMNASGGSITSGIAVDELQLMIAKIAHSFAVAELGISTFYAFLPPNIRSKSLNNIKMFVGSAEEADKNIPKKILHRLRLHSTKRGQQTLLVCEVNLFTHIVGANYQAIVGRLYDGTKEIDITREVFNEVCGNPPLL